MEISTKMAALPTEDTITDLIMRDELSTRQVNLGSQMIVQTPVRRFKPDLYMINGGQYVVQAKLGNEGKLIEAIGQVYDGISYAGMTGGFAVVYPGELRIALPPDILRKKAKDPTLRYKALAFFRPGDPRPSHLHFSGNVHDLADWITELIIKPPAPAAPPLERIVDTLQRTALYVLPALKHIKEEDIEYLFGNKPVFDNILQYEKGKYPLSDMRRAAAHFLINQILFYQVLSKIDPIKFPGIEEDRLPKPNYLLNYFRKALDVNYTPIFAFDIASWVPENEINMIRNVVKTVKAISPERIEYDLLGQLFHELIPLATRKPLAAYYTNPSVAEMLARLATASSDIKAIDLAVGSAGLLSSVYRAKRDIHLSKSKEFSQDDHKRFVGTDLTGIDVMPLAGHLAAINLSLQGFSDSRMFVTDRVRIAIWDATELEPGRTIPPMTKVLLEAYKVTTLDAFMRGKTPETPEEGYIAKGVLTPDRVGGEEITLDKAQLVIMNPPFTRRETIKSEKYKTALSERFKDYQRFLKGQLGYHGYFVFLADKFLEIGGLVALVLPATILRVRAAKGLRTMLCQNYHIEQIVTTWARAAFTEDAQFREILLVAKKIQNLGDGHVLRDDLKTNIACLKRLPRDFGDAKDLAVKLQSYYEKMQPGQAYDDTDLKGRVVLQSVLSSSLDNMFPWIAAFNWEIVEFWESLRKENS
jgi:hypothetical protein